MYKNIKRRHTQPQIYNKIKEFNCTADNTFGKENVLGVAF